MTSPLAYQREPDDEAESPAVIILFPSVARDILDRLIDQVRHSYPRSQVFFVGGDSARRDQFSILRGADEQADFQQRFISEPDRFGLTPRETQVLRLLAEGETNRTIAARLSISQNTVRAHVRSLLQKLRVINRVQAARMAIGAGLTLNGGDHGNPDSR